MSSVRVYNTLAGLADDCKTIATTTKPRMAKVVKRNVTVGKNVMKRIARAADGPHGKAYPSRITSEMLTPLSGEFGPHAGGTPVGAGWRHGVNTDIPKSADIQGLAFAKDVSNEADSLFWPGEG